MSIVTSSPLISFVIPTYNRVQWIAESVGSLLAQTVTDIEVIVVDDCSTDKTVPMLKEWLVNEPRFKLIQNEKNIGGGLSRNVGTNAALAPIIGVCDSDDFYSTTRAERILKFFEKNPKGVMLNTPYIRANLVSAPIQQFNGEPFDEVKFKKTGEVNFFCHPSAAYTKADFDEIGGYKSENEKWTDDYQFIAEWIHAGKKIGFDPDEYICFHRVLSDSMMTKFRGYDSKWNEKDEQ
jgi:glycosyltransferase involved in cell wall biosynthesis